MSLFVLAKQDSDSAAGQRKVAWCSLNEPIRLFINVVVLDKYMVQCFRVANEQLLTLYIVNSN